MKDEIEKIEAEYKDFNEKYDDVIQKAIDKGFDTKSQVFIGAVIGELENEKYDCISSEDIERIIDVCLDTVVIEQ